VTSIMVEYPTSESFIVRIYRIDTEDRRRITGLVEAMDSSGTRESFTDLDELGTVLNRRFGGKKKKSKTGTRKRKSPLRRIV
jgi:hypothetical protein